MSNMNMANMLAYTIQSSLYANNMPSLHVGYGRDGALMRPAQPQDDSYWLVIINRNNPKEKVKEWVVPGQNNTSVPAGVDTYMNNGDYIFAVATQYLSTLHMPQGAFYDFLVKYGAGRQLQRLEQTAVVLGCGTISRMSYILTGQCGPRDGMTPPSYEVASSTQQPALLLMSLMPSMSGAPPYSICDGYTFPH